VSEGHGHLGGGVAAPAVLASARWRRLALLALRTYPRDVATASASVRAIGEEASADDDQVGGQHAA
jgi:hypothetical protein